MDIQKEREAFQNFCEQNFDVERHEQTYFDEQTQSYENDLGECTESINMAWMAWQAKAQAVPEGFVLVPMVPSERMINAVRQCYEGEAYLPYSLYSEFVNQAIIERMEAQEPASD